MIAPMIAPMIGPMIIRVIVTYFTDKTARRHKDVKYCLEDGGR